MSLAVDGWPEGVNHETCIDCIVGQGHRLQYLTVPVITRLIEDSLAAPAGSLRHPMRSHKKFLKAIADEHDPFRREAA